MEAAFRALLANDTDVAALVGSRIYWSAIPQAAADPCIVMFVVSRLADAHHGGPSGLDNWLVQVNIRAITFTSAVAVRDAVVAKLHAKRTVQNGIKIVTVLQGERQRSEMPATQLYHTIQLDFSVWTGVAG